MIRYIRYQNQTTGSPAYNKWYLRAVTDETVDIDGLADHMSSHNTTFSRGNIKGILTDMVSCIKELMLDGKAVKLQDLAIFKIGLVSNGAATREEAKTTLVTGVRFNAKGTGEMAVAALKSEIHLKELKHYDGGEPLDDEDIDNDPTTPGSGGNTNPGSQPTMYTVTYVHNGSTVTTQQYAEGETIVEPAAPADGWIWGNTPSVMPARDVTVTSVEED